MTANKNQHWIPDSYLQAWSDPIKPEDYKPFVHVFNRDGSDHERRNPKNIFHEPDLYTIAVDGQRDLTIEHYFGGIEQRFIKARNALEQRNLYQEHLEAIYAFTAAMMVRLPHKIRQLTAFYANVVTKAKNIRINPNAAPVPPSVRGHSLSLQDVERMSSDPMGSWFPDAVNSQQDVLVKLFGCDVLLNDSPHPFLTSDSPAVVRFPPRKPGRMAARGLGWPGCTITLPLSPWIALRFSHGTAGLYEWVSLGWEQVFEINCHAIRTADRKIVSCSEDLFFVQTYLEAIRAATVAKMKEASE